MTRNTKLKILTLLYTTIAILAIGACTAVGLPETTSNPDNEALVVPTPTDSPADETPTPAATETPAPEPDPTRTPAPEDTPTPSPAPSESRAEEDGGDGSTAQDTQEAAGSGEDEAEAAQPGRPVEIRIDKLGVTAPFEWVGLTPEGNMEAPEGWNNAAWYEQGPVPGARGNSVIAGHYDAPGGKPALFYHLRSLEPGDRVTILTEHNEELTFEVTEVQPVHVSEAPLERIFGDTDQRNLNLITCEGAWDSSAGMYDQRLIVYTTLVSG